MLFIKSANRMKRLRKRNRHRQKRKRKTRPMASQNKRRRANLRTVALFSFLAGLFCQVSYAAAAAPSPFDPEQAARKNGPCADCVKKMDALDASAQSTILQGGASGTLLQGAAEGTMLQGG